MKNTPITARVSKGLFGKTKEPLLNVGPAGVKGKNTTRNVPSPATKKNYAMSSPFKKDPIRKESTATEGGKQVKTTTFEEKGVGKILTAKKPKANSTSNYDAAQVGLIDLGKDFVPTSAQRAKANKRNDDARAKDKAANDATDAANVSSDTGGEVKTKTYKKTLTTRDKGDTQYALERRNNIRAGKVSNRTKKRASINSGKAAAKGIDPKTGKYDASKDLRLSSDKNAYKNKLKSNKLEAKYKQSESNKKISGDQARGAEMQSEQNKSIYKGGTVKGDDRNKTPGETPESLGTKVVEPRKKAKAVVEIKAKPIKTDLGANQDIDTTLAKKTKGFFKKKSPLKMKYFK
jgi:hypothetical protein